MGLEGELTNRVKFQTVPESTKRERNPDPADSGKKSVSRSGAVPFPTFFSGFANQREAGDQLFCLCPRPFQRSAFPAIQSVSFGSDKKRGQQYPTRNIGFGKAAEPQDSWLGLILRKDKSQELTTCVLLSASSFNYN